MKKGFSSMRMTGWMAVAAVAVMVSACGGNGAKLFSKSLPDETQVIDGPTLALPPQFDLRPPRESQDYESVLRAQKGAEARSLITGSEAPAAGEPTAAAGSVPEGDAWLVNRTAAQTGVVADPGVREDLRVKAPEEVKAEEEAKAKQGLLGRWFGRNNDE
ncbi:MAG: DUF3035 domain-containing protein [Alphaproteobacteria bacterium]|nr:MAG: DUF3035 domain-containing protein [Alphaproteobacteria bacterium]